MMGSTASSTCVDETLNAIRESEAKKKEAGEPSTGSEIKKSVWGHFCYLYSF